MWSEMYKIRSMHGVKCIQVDMEEQHNHMVTHPNCYFTSRSRETGNIKVHVWTWTSILVFSFSFIAFSFAYIPESCYQLTTIEYKEIYKNESNIREYINVSQPLSPFLFLKLLQTENGFNVWVESLWKYTENIMVLRLRKKWKPPNNVLKQNILQSCF